MKKTSTVKRILVVEDEPAIGRVYVRTLTSPEVVVEVATSGSAAIEALNKGDYDLCLIDVRMPQMNGMELYSYITEKHPDIVERIIFATGDVMSGNTREFLEHTNRPYLPKPFTPDQLRAAVGASLFRTVRGERMLV